MNPAGAVDAGRTAAGASVASDAGGVPVELRAQLLDDSDRLIQRPPGLGPQLLHRSGFVEAAPRCAAARSSKSVDDVAAGASVPVRTASAARGRADPQLLDALRKPVRRVGCRGHEIGGAVGARARPPVGGPAPTGARGGGNVGQQISHLGERGGRIPLVRPTRADLRRHLADRRRQRGDQPARHR